MKKLHFITKTALFGAFAIAFAQLSFAVDATYYSSLDGKSGSDLREAITTLVYNKHNNNGSYDWYFTGMDYDTDGKTLLDIYSTCGHTSSSEHTYKCCCDGINREHVVPQSLFNSTGKQYHDRHHLFLVDGKTNGHRSSYAFGECSAGSKATCSSSSTGSTSDCENKELGKLGASTATDYDGNSISWSYGKVFEPDDEYKGDIARAIMYMVVRYATTTVSNNYPVTSWAGTTTDDGNADAMFSNSLSINYGLSDYSKKLLLKWHRNDPVSQKEITRNSGVETYQGNRNPFIDYPCLAEYLWGNKAGQTFSLASCCGSFDSNFTAGTSNGCSACTETESGGSESGGTNSGGSESGNSGSSGSDSGSSTTPVVSNDPILMVGKPIVVENVKQNDIVCTGTSTLQVHIANLIQSVSVTSSNSGIFTVSPSTISPSEGAAGITVTITKVSNGTATLNISGGVVNQAVTVICE